MAAGNSAFWSLQTYHMLVFFIVNVVLRTSAFRHSHATVKLASSSQMTVKFASKRISKANSSANVSRAGEHSLLGQGTASSEIPSFATNKLAFGGCIHSLKSKQAFEQLHYNIDTEFSGALAILSHPSESDVVIHDPAVSYICRLLLLSILVDGSPAYDYGLAATVCAMKWEGSPFNVIVESLQSGSSIGLVFLNNFLAAALKLNPKNTLLKKGIQSSEFVNRLSEKPLALYLFGPSASGKSHMTSTKGIGGTLAFVIDGDNVREASAHYHWLVFVESENLYSDCAYHGYDVWGMLTPAVEKIEPFKSKKIEVASKTSNIKKALQEFAVRAHVNLIKPDTGTSWGLYLYSSLGSDNLAKEIHGLLMSESHIVNFYAVVAPQATTSCAAWRRAKTSWKPYVDDGWYYSLLTVKKVFELYRSRFQAISITYIKTFLPKYAAEPRSYVGHKDENFKANSEMYWKKCVDSREVAWNTKELDLSNVADSAALFQTLQGMSQFEADWLPQ